MTKPAFYKRYFFWTLLLFSVEFIIGADIHDAVIRPYGGDFLVVILIYCLVKTFVNTPVVNTAGYVLLFAWLVEFSQYFHLINLLGLGHSPTARLLLGTSFSVADLLSYTLGIGTVIAVENLKTSLKNF